MKCLRMVEVNKLIMRRWLSNGGFRKSTVSLMVLQLIFFSAIIFERVEAADPDPVSDNPSGTTNFKLSDVFTNGFVTTGTGGIRAAVTTTNLPIITNQGITVVHFKLNPCGLNRPHTHPRATEVLSLISGGPIQAGFVDTSGVAHIEILNPGDVIVFPRGMLHYELNLGKTVAYFISGLNSENPGTLEAVGALMRLPARAGATAFNTNLSGYAQLQGSSLAYDAPPTLVQASRNVCVPGKDYSTER